MRHTFLFTAWLMWLLSHASRMALAPVLPLIEDDLGISHAQAGQIFVFLSIGYCGALFSVPFWSRLLGYRRTLQVSLITLTIVLFLMRWANGEATISTLAFFIGLASGTILPSAIPLITAAYGREVWGKSIAIFDSAAPSGQFLAPVLAVVMLAMFPWRYMFWAMSALSVLVLWIFLRTAPTEEPKAERAGGSIMAVIRNRSLVTLGCLWVLASGAALGAAFLIPVYLVKERGLELSVANQVFAAGRGIAIPCAVAAGLLTDRFPCRTILGWVLALAGVSLIGVALWPGNVGVGVWVIIEGGVVNMFFPVGLILIARVTASGVRGAATGIVIGAGAGFGIGVTPWLLGAAADAWSFQAGISVLGAMVMLSSLCVLRIERV